MNLTNSTYQIETKQDQYILIGIFSLLVMFIGGLIKIFLYYKPVNIII
jgi:hypothetical protein